MVQIKEIQMAAAFKSVYPVIQTRQMNADQPPLSPLHHTIYLSVTRNCQKATALENFTNVSCEKIHMG